MIEEALSYVDPTDRDTWVYMAMAIKSEEGDAGFSVWDSWSQEADNYEADAAKSVWNSITSGTVSIRKLWKEAKAGGWTPNKKLPRQKRKNKRPPLPVKSESDYQEVADKAQAFLDQSGIKHHPYLANKGFPDQKFHTWFDKLIVPVRNLRTNKLQTAQLIDKDGRKVFLKGGRVKEGVFRIGTGSCLWLVEGLATGMSVKLALENHGWPDQVIVCFASSNIPKIALALERTPNVYVVADADPKQAGEKAGIKSGRPFWIPPMKSGDANDYHQNEGLDALSKELFEFIKETVI